MPTARCEPLDAVLPIGESAALELMRRRRVAEVPVLRHVAPSGARSAPGAAVMRLGLEAIYRKPRTSVANPEHRVYPYLLRGLTIDDRIRCGARRCRAGSCTWWRDWASRRVLAWLSNTGHPVAGAGIAFRRSSTPRAGSPVSRSLDCWRPRLRCSMDGRGRAWQRVHRTAVALPEVRGSIPARSGGWLRGAAGSDRVQRARSALGASPELAVAGYQHR